MKLSEKSKESVTFPNRHYRLNARAIRDTLRDLNKDAKWLQEYLATSKRSVHLIMNDERVPGTDLMEKLQNLTGLSRAELLLPLGAASA